MERYLTGAAGSSRRKSLPVPYSPVPASLLLSNIFIPHIRVGGDITLH